MKTGVIYIFVSFINGNTTLFPPRRAPWRNKGTPLSTRTTQTQTPNQFTRKKKIKNNNKIKWKKCFLPSNHLCRSPRSSTATNPCHFFHGSFKDFDAGRSCLRNIKLQCTSTSQVAGKITVNPSFRLHSKPTDNSDILLHRPAWVAFQYLNQLTDDLFCEEMKIFL